MHVHALSNVMKLTIYYIICDMIKENESDVAKPVFDILPKGEFKFVVL